MTRIENIVSLKTFLPIFIILAISCNGPQQSENEVQEPVKADIIIYGGTSAAITAAVQAKRMGKSVIVVSPDQHLGGLSSGGLGYTDTGNKEVIGGLARDFYHRIYMHYQDSGSWKWQEKSEYGNKGQGTPAIDGDSRTIWIFEPHAAAGVSYHVGREANDVYNEKWNGVQTEVFHHNQYFQKNIDPYIIPGDPNSGLLPHISSEDPGKNGEGDNRLQAYNFRMTLSNHPENRVPFPKPGGYDPKEYELLVRVYDAGWDETFEKFDPIPNRKTDTNNHGPFSTDFIGMNYDYPEASYEQRAEIIKAHERYQKGLMYFLANDLRVPDAVRTEMSQWGLAKDEFTDNGNWPHQIYVREARRMIGDYVMTEHEVLGTRPVSEPVGMGSYTLDSHNTQRYVKSDGYVQNEGDIGVHAPEPYSISYKALVPKAAECQNLLVPVCVSSSHIAFGSIRMEPVFMILGQSAAAAAAIAINDEVSVQEVDYQKLKKRLLEDKQRLTLKAED